MQHDQYEFSFHDVLIKADGTAFIVVQSSSTLYSSITVICCVFLDSLCFVDK